MKKLNVLLIMGFTIVVLIINCKPSYNEIRDITKDAIYDENYKECISYLEENWEYIKEAYQPWANFTIGECYMNDNQPEKALEHFERLEIEDYINEDILEYLYDLHNQLGSIDGYYSTLKHNYNLMEYIEKVRDTADAEKFIAILNTEIEENPDKAEELIEVGGEYLIEEHVDIPGIECFAGNSEDSTLKNRFAYFMYLEEWEEVEGILFSRLDENNIYADEDLLYAIAHMYLTMNNEQAIDYLEMVLDKDPYYFAALHEEVEYYKNVSADNNKLYDILIKLYLTKELTEHEYDLLLEMVKDKEQYKLYSMILEDKISQEGGEISLENPLLKEAYELDSSNRGKNYMEFMIQSNQDFSELPDQEQKDIIGDVLASIEHWTKTDICSYDSSQNNKLSLYGRYLYLLFDDTYVNKSKLFCFDVLTGQQLFSLNLDYGSNNLYIHKDIVLIRGDYTTTSGADFNRTDKIIAVDPQSKSIIWTFNTDSYNYELGVQTIKIINNESDDIVIDLATGEETELPHIPMVMPPYNRFHADYDEKDIIQAVINLGDESRVNISLDSSVESLYEVTGYIILISNTYNVYCLDYNIADAIGKVYEEPVYIPSIQRLYTTITLSPGSSKSISKTFHEVGEQTATADAIGPDFFVCTPTGGTVDWMNSTSNVSFKIEATSEAVSGIYYVSFPFMFCFSSVGCTAYSNSQFTLMHYKITVP